MSEFTDYGYHNYMNALYQELIQSNNYGNPHQKPTIDEIALVRQLPEYHLLRRSLERWYYLRFKSKKFPIPYMGMGDIKLTWYSIRMGNVLALKNLKNLYETIQRFIWRVYKEYGGSTIVNKLGILEHWLFIAIFDSMELPICKVRET